MRTTRRGFTLVEVLLVTVVMALIMALALPKFMLMREQSTARSSRLMLASAFAAARASAVQKGQPATLTIEDGAVSVTVLSGLNEQEVRVLGPMAFNGSTTATLKSLDNVSKVTYDPRGLIKPLLPGITRYELIYGEESDTLCISASGLILPRDCRL